MIDEENYKKIALECAVCKTRFEIWISLANFSEELETNIRKNFYRYCPICRLLEELKNKQG